MSSLRVEAFAPAVDDWITVGEVQATDQFGTISANTTRGRILYLFGVDPVENHGVIKRIMGATDIAFADQRVVSYDEAEVVAIVSVGEQYQVTVETDINPRPRRRRFTYNE